jgi:hypothetical protein
MLQVELQCVAVLWQPTCRIHSRHVLVVCLSFHHAAHVLHALIPVRKCFHIAPNSFWFHFTQETTYSNEFLQDLAGNAFNGHCCAAVTLVSKALRAHIALRKRDRFRPTPVFGRQTNENHCMILILHPWSTHLLICSIRFCGTYRCIHVNVHVHNGHRQLVRTSELLHASARSCCSTS